MIAQAESIPALFSLRVRATPSREAFRHPVGSGWKSLTWTETDRWVRELSAGMRDLGIRAEDRVAILAGTRLSRRVPQEALRRAFAGLLVVVATFILYQNRGLFIH